MGDFGILARKIAGDLDFSVKILVYINYFYYLCGSFVFAIRELRMICRKVLILSDYEGARFSHIAKKNDVKRT